jgi:hypothetical protein
MPHPTAADRGRGHQPAHAFMGAVWAIAQAATTSDNVIDNASRCHARRR